MIYIIDTISFNSYFNYKKNQTKTYPRNVNIEGLSELLTNAVSNGDEVWIHSASMYELLIKCYRSKIQDEYKKKNQFNLGEFADDYQFLVKENHFRIMNEKPYYFKWEEIVDYYNNGTELNIDSFIKTKMSMELNFLHQYIMFVNSICSYRWYDEYKNPEEAEYVHNELWFGLFNSCMNEKIEEKLNSILKDYYYKNTTKETVKNEIDLLLGYVLNKYQEFIKNQLAKNDDIFNNKLLLCQRRFELQTFVKKTEGEKISNHISGANFAKKVFINHQKELEQYLIEFSKGVFDKLPVMTETAKLYITYLFKNTILNGSKITKNDSSDYMIISAGDLYVGDKKVVLITYDKKMKRFLAENNLFYDESVYKKVYIEK